MPPDLAAELLGAVNAMRTEMDRRLKEINGKLDGVCEDVVKLKTDQAVEAALAEQSRQDSSEHVLSFRWRVTVAIAASGAVLATVLGALNYMAGH